MKTFLSLYLPIIVIGSVIGLLAGFTVSPVLVTILTSLIAAAVSITSVFISKETGEALEGKLRSVRISSVALAILTVFILIGSFIGMTIRIDRNRLVQAETLSKQLSPPPDFSYIISAWTDYGYDHDAIRSILLNTYLGSSVPSESKSAPSIRGVDEKALTVGLFNAQVSSANECSRLRMAIKEGNLITEMKMASNIRFPKYAETFSEPSVLEKIVEVECWGIQ